MKKEVMSSALVKLAVNDLELLQSMATHHQSPQRPYVHQSRPVTTAANVKPQKQRLRKETSSVSIAGTRPGTAATMKINLAVDAAVERAVTRKISQRDQFGNYFMVKSLKQMQKVREEGKGGSTKKEIACQIQENNPNTSMTSPLKNRKKVKKNGIFSKA